ncbi:MAG: hypothetical protein J3R72DRAFT_458487 [Linnemannia gamsii]|nr:MAG: hypothetical protein J3R72DRAFT_458487 [Linnemannia gamsii]
MTKICLLILVLSTLVLTVKSVSRVDFYGDGGFGKPWKTCTVEGYNTCHRLPSNGVSSASYANSDWAKTKFTLTVFSGESCDGDWFQWSFSQNIIDPTFDIEYVNQLNDRIRSYRVADYLMSTGYGPHSGYDRTVKEAYCW